MATYKRGDAALMSYDGDVRMWDFTAGDVVTTDPDVVAKLDAQGAICIAFDVIEDEKTEEQAVSQEVLDMVQGMTKDQISVFALNEFDATIVVKTNKSKDEMLVELQAAFEAFKAKE